MIHAYDRTYLPDAEDCLSGAFDYAVNGCGLGGNEFAEMFVVTGYASQFERGNPAVVSGMSGIELVDKILYACGLEDRVSMLYCQGPDASAEYWAGWALAQYQWERSYGFHELFCRVPYSMIVSLYHPFHEADVSRLFERIDELVLQCYPHAETRLARMRRLRGFSQRELSAAAGVGIKTIQSYEQRSNSINKAQVGMLSRLAWVLGCSIDALLEFEPYVALEYDGRAKGLNQTL